MSASEGESEQKSECSKRRNCSRRSDAVGGLVGAAQVKVGPGPGPTDRPTDRPTRQAGRLSSLAEWGKEKSNTIFKMALSKILQISSIRLVCSRTTLILEMI